MVFVSGSGMLGVSIAFNAVSHHGACTAIFVAVACMIGFLLSSIRTLGQISWLAWAGMFSIASAGKISPLHRDVDLVEESHR